MNDDLRVTDWLLLNRRTTGKYGKITNEEWLELEKERFEEMSGDKYDIIFNDIDEGAIYKVEA